MVEVNRGKSSSGSIVPRELIAGDKTVKMALGLNNETTIFNPLMKQSRRQAGLTQQELAIRAAVGVRTVRRIENFSLIPKRETVAKVAEALNAQVSNIFPEWLTAYLEEKQHEEVLKQRESLVKSLSRKISPTKVNPLFPEANYWFSSDDQDPLFTKAVKDERREEYHDLSHLERRAFQLKFGFVDGKTRTDREVGDILAKEDLMDGTKDTKSATNRLLKRAFEKLRSPEEKRNKWDLDEITVLC